MQHTLNASFYLFLAYLFLVKLFQEREKHWNNILGVLNFLFISELQVELSLILQTNIEKSGAV